MVTTAGATTFRGGDSIVRSRAALAARAIAAVTVALLIATSAPSVARASPAPGWSTPEYLSAAGLDAAFPRLVGAPNGRVTAIWSASPGMTRVIQASYSDDHGATWSLPMDLSNAAFMSDDPHIGVDDAGNLTALWSANDASTSFIQISHSIDGGVTWSTPKDLSDTTQHAQQPRLAVSGDGSITAVWTLGPDPITWATVSTVVQSRHSTDGGVSWDPVIDLSSSGQPVDEPQLAVGPLGVTAVWAHHNGSTFVIQARHSTDPTSGWAPVAELSDATTSAFIPQLVTSATGVTVAWQRGGFAEAAVSSDGATWSSAARLSATGATQVHITGSTDDDSVTVVWSRSGVIEAAHLTAGTWATPVTISQSSQADSPYITHSSDGVLAIAWYRLNVPSGVYVSLSEDGADWSAEKMISTPFESGVAPVLGTAADGRFIALWRSVWGMTYRIQSAHALIAPTITSPAPLQPSVGDPYSFQVTASGNWPMTFAVTAGSLPTGLSMSSAGLISGTPTDANAATFTVTASNGITPDATADYTLTPVSAPAVPATPVTPPTAPVAPPAPAGPPPVAPAVPAATAHGTLPTAGADWLPVGTVGAALLAVGALLIALPMRRPLHARVQGAP